MRDGPGADYPALGRHLSYTCKFICHQVSIHRVRLQLVDEQCLVQQAWQSLSRLLREVRYLQIPQLRRTAAKELARLLTEFRNNSFQRVAHCVVWTFAEIFQVC